MFFETPVFSDGDYREKFRRRVEGLNELKDVPKCEHYNNKYHLLPEVSSPIIDLTTYSNGLAVDPVLYRSSAQYNVVCVGAPVRVLQYARGCPVYHHHTRMHTSKVCARGNFVSVVGT